MQFKSGKAKLRSGSPKRSVLQAAALRKIRVGKDLFVDYGPKYFLECLTNSMLKTRSVLTALGDCGRKRYKYDKVKRVVSVFCRCLERSFRETSVER